MTTSILNDVLLLKNEPATKLQEYFHTINLTIFDPIFHSSSSTEEAKQKVLFIIVSSSEDSPMVILKQDRLEEGINICEYLQIPEYLQNKLINLSDSEVRKATTQYLEQFASQEFRTLMFMKIQLVDMDRAITNREFTSKKDEIIYWDHKENGRAIQECRRLATEITKLESAIKAKVKYLGIENMQEWLKKSTKKHLSSANTVYGGSGLEHSDLIK